MKKLVSLFLALVLSLGLCVPALAEEFTDVPANHPFYSAIMDCAGKGIVGGYSDGTFQPANTVTRSNFSVMLSRAFYAADVEKYTNDFNLSFSAFHPNYMAMANNGAWDNVSWDKNAMFNTSSNFSSEITKGISRYDMAQLMANIMTQKGPAASESDKNDAASKIADYADIPDQYRDAVLTVYALGIIGGFADGTFGGAVTMNRGQAAVVIYRLAQYVGDGSGTGPEASVDIDPANVPEDPAGSGSSETAPTPDKPETPVTSGGATLSNGKAITEANVKELLNELKAKYPNNALYAEKGTKINSNIYKSFGYAGGIECAGWAALVSDYIFGKNAIVRVHENFDQLRIGDVLYSDAHTCVIISVAPCAWCHKPAYATSDSNASYKVAWYDDYNTAVVCNNPSCAGYHGTPTDDPYIIITRYPADSTVPYLSLN